MNTGENLGPNSIGHSRGSEISDEGGWRDGEVAWWLRELAAPAGFSSQNPHGGSHLSVAQVPGYFMLSSDICGHQACTMWYTYIHAGKTLVYME